MQLYAGPTSHFVQDAIHNAIAGKLESAFQDAYRYRPGPAEVGSWRNSLRAMSQVLQAGSLERTNVILEYQLPMSSCRLDCMVLGQDDDGRDGAHIVELKQWERAEPSDVPDCVVTWVAGAQREVLHPSAQVFQYRTYLEDMHSAFRGTNPVALGACSYLHNAARSDGAELLDPRYRDAVDRAPLFFGAEVGELAEQLRRRVGRGDPGHVLDRVANGTHRPSKALMKHVATMIEGNRAYTLLDEQLVVFNSILAMVRQGYHGGRQVVLVRGGPGTGKSVIAANLLAALGRTDYSTFHATGSKAFTENLKRTVGPRARSVFKYFNSFESAPPGSIDVLICDEAHRIRESSGDRFHKRSSRPAGRQVDELLDAARVPVFFLDDIQVVRPGEVGSSQLIRDAAAARGLPVKEFELDVQFRCKGSEAFIGWVDNTLGIHRTPHVMWNDANEFDFRIVPSVEELDRMVRERDAAGEPSRLVAGFCWPWAKELKAGRLVEDVQVGDWRRPWNARSETTRLPKGIPKSNFWATDPNGLGQVGCVYTAQGFEFDYVGVIVGRDLRYDPVRGEWIGDRTASKDTKVNRAKGDDEFLRLVKNTYRVLLTRGLKGCWVTFLDPATEAFVRSRVESRPDRAKPLRGDAPTRPLAADPEASTRHLRGLTRLGLELWPLFARCTPGIEETALVAMVNDVALHLEREDLADWRADARLREALRASIRRSLSDLPEAAERDELADAVLRRATGWKPA